MLRIVGDIWLTNFAGNTKRIIGGVKLITMTSLPDDLRNQETEQLDDPTPPQAAP
jgi:hypothetical protein